MNDVGARPCLARARSRQHCHSAEQPGWKGQIAFLANFWRIYPATANPILPASCNYPNNTNVIYYLACWHRDCTITPTSEFFLQERNMILSVFKTTLVSFVMLAAATLAGTAYAADVERSFSVEPGDRVVVDVERAEIEITSWDRSEVDFSVEQEDELEFEFSQQDGVVTIRGRDKDRDGLFGWFSFGSPAEITLKVPYRQNLNLRTRGGDIELDRLQGEFTARTSGGGIEAGDVDGPVDAKTSGGSIELENASGSVSAETSGGSIRLDTVAGEVTAKTSGGSIRIGQAGAAVAARTSGGSIDVKSAAGAVQARTSGGSVEVGFGGQPDGNSELRTSGGNVTVYLPDDIRANLRATASGGRVSSDLPEVTPENSAGGGNLSQSLNGGGPEIVLQTSGGSVRIRRQAD